MYAFERVLSVGAFIVQPALACAISRSGRYFRLFAIVFLEGWTSWEGVSFRDLRRTRCLYYVLCLGGVYDGCDRGE